MKRIVPALLTLGLLAYVFGTTDLHSFGTAMRGADVARFALTISLMSAVALAWDGVCYRWLLGRFAAPTSWWDAVQLRGASWLLNIVNYAAANAMVVAYLKQTKGVGLGRGASAVLFLMLVDVYALAAVATAGAAARLPEQFPAFLAVDAALAALMLGHLLYWRRGWRFGPIDRARRWPVFAAFAQARAGDYLRLAALRLPMVGIFVLYNALLLPCFKLHIPLATIAAYTPIINFVAALPISVGGFGTHQVATRALFGAALGNPLAVADAYSVAALVGATMVRFAYGGILYAIVVRKLK